MAISEAYNCDCLEYMRTLPDKFFDLAIADPPYGGAGNQQLTGGQIRPTIRPLQTKVNHAFGGRFEKYNVHGQAERGQRNSGGVISWDTAPCEDFFNELYRVSKAQIIWGANYFQNMPATRCFIVWRKTNVPENFTMAMCEYAWTSFDGNAKVFDFSAVGQQNRFHPTAKPPELYSWLLRLFAKEGQTIFDPMMGSQSSRIAAYKMGFDYYGCELDKEYYERGCERFEKECHGVIKAPDGRTVQQLSLF